MLNRRTKTRANDENRLLEDDAAAPKRTPPTRRLHSTSTSTNRPKTRLDLVCRRARQLGPWLKSRPRTLAALTVLTVLTAAEAIMHFFCSEWSWVHRRCALAAVVPTLQNRIECIEAKTHKYAMFDEGLRWPVDPGRGLSAETISQLESNRPVGEVHFVLTEYIANEESLDLARCAVESACRQCGMLDGPPPVNAEGSKGLERACRVNLWVVDGAAVKYNDGLSDRTVSPVDALVATMKASDPSSPYCVRIVGRDLKRRYVGPDCPKPRGGEDEDGEGGEDDPPEREPSRADDLLDWITSEGAENQITAHSSDAWRLVALREMGGLYLDLDVVAMSNLLLRLPKNAVPVQPRVGAYRMNGGALRLGGGGDDEDEDGRRGGDSSVAHSSTASEEGGALRGGGRLGRSGTLSHRRRTFTDAMVEDHLYWAPRLARLPKTRKGQTFGFLGPCALTRVFIGKDFEDDVMVLPEAVVEPRVDAALCDRYKSKESLAIHFSGKSKENWRQMIDRRACLLGVMNNACPRMMKSPPDL